MNPFPPFWRNFLIGAVVSITLAGVLIFLDSQNLLSLEFQFIGAKAIIAAQGPDPRLSAIGYVFPPFLIYLTMLLTSPISTQILLGTGLISFVIWLVSQLQCRWFWRGIILILLLLNPAFLILLMTSPTWTAISLFLGLSVLLYWHLINPRDQKYPLSVNLVLLGLTLAPLVLLRYEFWFLSPVFMILSWFCIQSDNIQLKFTMILVTSFMSIVSISGFLYVNWLINSDPFYFLDAVGNGLRWPSMEFLLEPAPGLQALGSSLIWLGKMLPIYCLICILVSYRIRDFLVARILLMALPMLVLILLFWQNNFLPQAAIFGAFSILIPVTLLQFSQITPPFYGLIVITLLLSLMFNGYSLNLNRFTPEESLVWRQMTGQSVPKTGAISRWRQRQLDQQEISDVLFRRLRPEQKVLLDNTVNFSFIYLLQNSHVFILPHQYEFSVALSQPEEVVDYILVRREIGIQPGADKVLNRQSTQDTPEVKPTNHRPNRRILTQQLDDGGLFNHFELIVNNTFYQLFQRE
ncbi:hypothetical protein GlitD10_1707 [Gloeomargarita lithophora Alchichica-D10]|uniref:Glycosyltransferase RgtA/B/C/D-like domain-containing protein n=1 Tax=Gloeomargarita lithophora Alchichica-D10 TaxID=1188229 RepID=A0A1J0ADP1_9CYAN|nr:hypothetical protein [Gloeomargarita lithophora]APB34032.1 hypothetical protein GlitD10_1707 [Gloeomargarita lithophora Alchichica-D10]